MCVLASKNKIREYRRIHDYCMCIYVWHNNMIVYVSSAKWAKKIAAFTHPSKKYISIYTKSNVFQSLFGDAWTSPRWTWNITHWSSSITFLSWEFSKLSPFWIVREVSEMDGNLQWHPVTYCTTWPWNQVAHQDSWWTVWRLGRVTSKEKQVRGSTCFNPIENNLWSKRRIN